MKNLEKTTTLTLKDRQYQLSVAVTEIQGKEGLQLLLVDIKTGLKWEAQHSTECNPLVRDVSCAYSTAHTNTVKFNKNRHSRVNQKDWEFQEI